MKTNMFVLCILALLSFVMMGCWDDCNKCGHSRYFDDCDDWDDNCYVQFDLNDPQWHDINWDGQYWEGDDCFYHSAKAYWVCEEDGVWGENCARGDFNKWACECTGMDCKSSHVENPTPTRPDAVVGRACVDKSECGDGYDCLQNACAVSLECSNDSQCKDNLMCINGLCLVPECRSNAECSNEEICTEGRCIPCQTEVCDTSIDVECVFANQCESGICSNGQCLAPGTCLVDDNCEGDKVCLGSACVDRPECLSDAECGEGRICNASNKCEDDVECRQDKDCGDNMFCVFNMCAQCRLDCECPDQMICMNGACIAG